MQKQQIQDHLGQTFPSITKLCNYWNINRKTFIRHYSNNEDIKNIIEYLTNTQPQQYIDHLGNIFISIIDMCKYHNITPATYKYRKNKGLSIEQILIPKQNKSIIVDHNGNQFNSVQEMCQYYNINKNTYQHRRKKGASLQEALTSPTRIISPIIDHKGNTFSSTTAMCDFYKIDLATYNRRINNYNYTLEEALTKPVIKKTTKEQIDPFGNKFNSITTLCEHYKILQPHYYKSLKQNYSQLEALNIIPKIHNRIKNTLITDQLYVKQHIINDYYMCIFNKNDIILHRNNILQYALKYYSTIYKIEE